MVGEALPHLTLLVRGEYASSSQSPAEAKRTSSKKSFSKCGDAADFDLKLRSGESVDPDNRPGREGTHGVSLLHGKKVRKVLLQIYVVADDFDEIGHGQAFKPQNLGSALKCQFRLLLHQIRNRSIRSGSNHTGNEQQSSGPNCWRITEFFERRETTAEDCVVLRDLKHFFRVGHHVSPARSPRLKG